MKKDLSDHSDTVAGLLVEARRRHVARVDMMALLAHHWQRPHVWLVAHDHEPAPLAVATAVRAGLEARADNVPLAYLVGHKEFFGLDLNVTPDVLVPRPETEGLVDWTIELLQTDLRDLPCPVIVDLGTGSGAIALAVKHACPRATVVGVDASAPALAVAQGNAARLGLNVALHVGNWWDCAALRPLLGHIDVVISNPPYIREADDHLLALRHEPRQALVAGQDGLTDIRSIIAGAPQALRRGGHLLIEHGFDQGHAVRMLLLAAHFTSVQTRADLAGHDRCTSGRGSDDA